MERKIVAINGTIGSGKDTFSKTFIDNGYMRISFAESLKDAVAAIFGWDREMLEGSTPEARVIRETVDEYWSSVLGYDVTPRWVLQNLGTDVLRKHFHDNIWIFSLENKIRNFQHDKIIITDCRFPNEVKMVRRNEGTIIEVQRNLPVWYDDAVRYNRMCESIAGDWVDAYDLLEMLPESLYDIHSSEYGWVGINYPDYVVSNNSSIEHLENEAHAIIKAISQL